tara:strand:- start:1465 stop:1749 length:285 start_codon:yes stop_codon:yes gene_type:complete
MKKLSISSIAQIAINGETLDKLKKETSAFGRYDLTLPEDYHHESIIVDMDDMDDGWESKERDAFWVIMESIEHSEDQLKEEKVRYIDFYVDPSV